MKKAASAVDDLRPEYDVEFFKHLKPNRFPARAKLGLHSVVLDPDVAEVFRSSEGVNKVLRLAITHSAKRATARPAKKLSSKKAR
jgi:hypothetical protein